MNNFELAQQHHDRAIPEDDNEQPSSRCVYFEDSLIDALNDIEEC